MCRQGGEYIGWDANGQKYRQTIYAVYGEADFTEIKDWYGDAVSDKFNNEGGLETDPVELYFDKDIFAPPATRKGGSVTYFRGPVIPGGEVRATCEITKEGKIMWKQNKSLGWCWVKKIFFSYLIEGKKERV